MLGHAATEWRAISVHHGTLALEKIGNPTKGARDMIDFALGAALQAHATEEFYLMERATRAH